MAANSIDVNLKLIAKEAAKEIEGIRTQLGHVETAEGEVETAGKAMARGLERAAQDIEADLKMSASAADALGQSLGPELSAKVGQSGLDGFVAKLRTAGLTTQEIEADADSLAAAIKHLDDVGSQMDGMQSGLAKVGPELDNIEGKTNQNRSVMANWAGNTATEMPGMAGAFGPLSMALGQTVEYAAEGGINFKKMLGAGLAMAAVSVVVMEITSEMAKQKKLEEERNERVKDYTVAIREGKDSVEELAAAAEAADGKIKAFTGTMGETENITDDLAKLGLTAGQFFELVKGGGPAVVEWSTKMEEAGHTGETYDKVLAALITTTQEYEHANKMAAEQSKVFGLTSEALADITDEVTRSQGAARDAADDLRQAQSDLRDEQLDAIETGHEFETSVLDLESAYYDLQQQIVENYTTLGDATVADGEKAQSTRNLKSATYDLGEQVYETSQKYAESQGATEGSTAAVALQIESLKASKLQFPELGVLIDEYIAKLRSIPTSIDTTFNARGDAPGQRTGARADGGLTMPGRYRVGERGPEDVDIMSPANVTPTDKLGGSGDTYVITQVLPNGVRLGDLMTTAERIRRKRNGF